jgi:hypothetical protein
MIRLTFHDADETPSESLDMSDFRVTGGALWNPLEHGLLASYSEGLWKHRGHYYSEISAEGGGCMLFGITRDPTLVSDPVDRLLFSGRALQADGIVIAEYVEHQDMWHGLVRPIWWTAMRIISARAVTGLVDSSRVVRLNPWESPAHRWSGPVGFAKTGARDDPFW